MPLRLSRDLTGWPGDHLFMPYTACRLVDGILENNGDFPGQERAEEGVSPSLVETAMRTKDR